ncbi:predicted thioesterase [Staphylococcus capitis]|nr:predicted thioesterase [Staphylococcus capitis]
MIHYSYVVGKAHQDAQYLVLISKVYRFLTYTHHLNLFITDFLAYTLFSTFYLKLVINSTLS